MCDKYQNLVRSRKSWETVVYYVVRLGGALETSYQQERAVYTPDSS